MEECERGLSRVRGIEMGTIEFNCYVMYLKTAVGGGCGGGGVLSVRVFSHLKFK